MTMPLDVFSPAGSGADPQSAASEWTAALNDPKVRASMLSIGLQLMQPPSFGQTGGGQVAQAVGAGGETVSRFEAEDRADAETARKERDTSSMIDYRADRSDVAQAQAGAAQTRADASVMNAQSAATLRTAQAQVALANLGKIEQQVRALELKNMLYPNDQQAKIELSNARTALTQAQAGLAAAKTENVGKVLDIQQQNVDLRRTGQGLKDTASQQRNEAALARTYETARQNYEKRRILEPNLPQFPPMATWRQNMGVSQQMPSGSPAAPAQPAPGATPQVTTTSGQYPPDPRDNTRQVGKIYMTPNGALKYLGNRQWTTP